MLNKILLIGGTTVASVGAGVGGYYIFHQSSSEEKTINQLLDATTRGKKITKTNKTGQPAIQKWKNYITANTKAEQVNTKDIFEIKNWASIKETKETVPDTFVEACDKQLTTKVKDKQDQKYKNYVDYCTIP